MLTFIKTLSNWLKSKFQSLVSFYYQNTKSPNTTSLDFQTLFQSTPGCYLILDPKLIIVAVNDAYLRATMTERESLIGQYMFDAFPDNPDDQNATGENNLGASLQRVLSLKKPDTMAIQKYDIRRPSAEGGGFEERYWSPVNSPILNDQGKVSFIIHHVEDVTEYIKIKNLNLAQIKITEQKEAEILRHTQALHHASMLNSGIINATNDLIAAWDTKLCFTQFNKAYKRAFNRKFGIKPKLGMSLLKLLEYLPKQCSELAQLWQRALSGETFTATEKISEDTNLYYYETKYHAIYDEHERIIGACQMGRNVTEREILVASLEAAKKELEAAIIAKTKFFSNISHEFRTPLTLMLSPLEDSLSDLEQSFSTAQRERQQLIYSNALRLLKLVNSLLDFSRFEANCMQATYRPTDLSSFTKKLISCFQSTIEKAGLKLIVDIPALKELVYVDKEMWEKIVFNLLSNAFKFTLQGCITVTLKQQEDCVKLQVQDTGVGIPPKALPHLFERFFRVEETQGRSFEGTGIGLSLVKELVQLHKGTIQVESKLGQGSTFTITLPLGTAHLPQERISTQQDSYQLNKDALPSLINANTALSSSVTTTTIDPSMMTKASFSKAHILLADDNSDMCNYIRSLLEKYWSIETVTNGKAALEAARKHPPDLILTDEMMPQMSGTELIQTIRADLALKSIPVIIISAGAGEEARITGLQAGANDYLTKPFSTKELITRINVHLELAYLRRQLEKQVHLQQEFICHEIRNPLNIICGSTKLLRNAYQDFEKLLQGKTVIHAEKLLPIYQQFKEWIETISACAEQQAITINEVLDLSKLENFEYQLNITLFNPEEIINSVVQIFKQQIKIIQKKLTLELILPAEKYWVEGDVAHLKQVLFNLLSNAVKFTEQGSITLNLSYLTTGNLNHMVDMAITLKDTGIGMCAEEAQRLFKPFVQANPRIANEYGGSGLGLVISKKLIELMGGKIEVKSKKDVGTTFYFTIRCKKALAPTILAKTMLVQHTVQEEKEINSSSKNILVVDDNKLNQTILAKYLQKMEHRCQVANNGLEALELYKKEQFDVIFIDFEMPIMNGPTATKKIREFEQQLRRTRSLIIGVSGNVSTEATKIAMESGMDAYLSKPYSSDKIYQALKQTFHMPEPQSTLSSAATFFTNQQKSLQLHDNSEAINTPSFTTQADSTRTVSVKKKI